MNVIETSGLGKRYGRTWALRDAALAIPAGYVVALVGPNGAGKTTLLHSSVGLTRPTTGRVTVLDSLPAGSLAALDQIAFVAQDAPLYKNLPVAARLDPLARHDFMASLMTAVAEDRLSVVLSSHVIADLERVADYLIVLSRGQ